MAVTHILGVLPARWGSTRFPGKPLHNIAGKSLIQRVWEQCSRCEKLDQVVVATDDQRIMDAVSDFGGTAVMTRDDHPSGTDRIAEVAEQFPAATHYINIQGDEPQIDPDLVDQLATELVNDPDLPMITAANPLAANDNAVSDPNVVKVTLTRDSNALYFSRSPIPFARQTQSDLVYYRHKGIYGFQRKFLLDFVSWSPSMLEKAESLEQLRALENG
ncbi:MAG: 3-deoxy-manno-octulosonate cytidylyltransferase, partial [Verrucomicrobiota bacterium]